MQDNIFAPSFKFQSRGRRNKSEFCIELSHWHLHFFAGNLQQKGECYEKITEYLDATPARDCTSVVEKVSEALLNFKAALQQCKIFILQSKFYLKEHSTDVMWLN